MQTALVCENDLFAAAIRAWFAGSSLTILGIVIRGDRFDPELILINDRPPSIAYAVRSEGDAA